MDLKKLGIVEPLQNLFNTGSKKVQDESKLLLEIIGVTPQTAPSLSTRIRSFTLSAAAAVTGRTFDSKQAKTKATVKANQQMKQDHKKKEREFEKRRKNYFNKLLETIRDDSDSDDDQISAVSSNYSSNWNNLSVLNSLPNSSIKLFSV